MPPLRRRRARRRAGGEDDSDPYYRSLESLEASHEAIFAPGASLTYMGEVKTNAGFFYPLSNFFFSF